MGREQIGSRKKAEKALKSKNMGEKGEGGSESSQGKKD